ncbi:MAG: preprotein translocase subunit YajC [Phycisphaerae bacterium]|nr:preprotein translocase subunit YajC [Phycisphaerae bacterium]
MNNIWILAEAGDGEGQVITMEESSGTETQNTGTLENGANGTTETPQTQSPGSNPLFFVMIAVLGVYMFFIMFRGPKKKQQEHQKMVQALSKNDRVRTIGGIFGTVLDVRDDEIVLKIDESTNTKMRVSPQAIATVLTDKAE